MPVSDLVNAFQELGGVKVSNYSDLPQTYAYIAVAGENILAYGKAGQKSRIRSFFKGCTGSAVHTKAFIVSMAYNLWPGEVEIYIKETESADQAREIEQHLEGRDFPKIYIHESQELNELYEVSTFLWTKLTDGKELSEEVRTCANLCCDNGDIIKSVMSRSPSKNEFNEILGNYYQLNQRANNQTLNGGITQMRITQDQVLEAINRLQQIIDNYGSPKIRFMTNTDYVVELEFVNRNGAQVLNQLLTMTQGNGFVDLTVGEQTNKATGNQFHINELAGSNYAVLAQIRDTNALNVIVP